MAFVSLKSRLPEIAGALPLRVGAAIHSGTEQIASDAAARVEEQGLHRTGELHDSIQAREGNAKTFGHVYGIWMAWYGIFAEFGTTYEPARPFLIPAAEAGKDNLVEEVRTVLEEL